MKKTLSLLMAVIIVFVCIAPFTVYAEPAEGVYTVSEEIYADAYMLIDLNNANHTPIAAKNAEKKKYPASLTKIATAMVILNSTDDLEKETTVSDTALKGLKAIGAQSAGLKAGDKVTMDKLLSLILVYSACDAANVAAEAVSGNIDDFVKKMNEWAKSVGCTSTNFTNCTGLHDDEHYSTAKDLSLMTVEALKNEDFVKYSSAKSVSFAGNVFMHTNFMLNAKMENYYYEYAKGIKTGTTKEAGSCVITRASKGLYNYLAIVLDSPTKTIKGTSTKCSFVDAKTLFEWAFNNLEYADVAVADESVYEIPVEKGKRTKTVQLGVVETVRALVPADAKPEEIKIEPVEAPELLTAPITKGSEICSANVTYNGLTVTSVKLCALQRVEKSFIHKIGDGLKAFFGNKIVKTIIVLGIVIFLLYFIYCYISVKREQKRAAERRRRQQQRRRREMQAQGKTGTSNAQRRPPSSRPSGSSQNRDRRR